MSVRPHVALAAKPLRFRLTGQGGHGEGRYLR